MSINLNKIGFFILLLFIFSWLLLVFYPVYQFSRLSINLQNSNQKQSIPPHISGEALVGSNIYIHEGCVACHTQEVRQKSMTSVDIDRGWGMRPMVARDYISQKTELIGFYRYGPDLANVGNRYSNPEYYYFRLFDPKLIHSDSLMPSYSHLFIIQKIQGSRSKMSLNFPRNYLKIPAGYEVIPTIQARNLVSYLLSLSHDYTVPEIKESAVKKPSNI